MEKIYRVQMNNKGMPNFATAVEIADRPQGEWVEIYDGTVSGRCSICGWESHLYEDDVCGMPYCPNCGAHMKGADDERVR